MIDSNPIRQGATTRIAVLPALDLIVVEADPGPMVREAAWVAVQFLVARARVCAVSVPVEEHGGSRPGALRAAIDALVDCNSAYGWPPYGLAGRRAAVLLLSERGFADDSCRVVGVQERDELLAAGGICELLTARRWPVYTIGVGAGGELAGALREVARATRGRSYVAPTTEELRRVCAATIEDLSD